MGQNEVHVNRRLRQFINDPRAEHVVCNHGEVHDAELQNMMLVMELADGGDAYEYINARAAADNHLTAVELEQVITGLVNGLNLLHDAGIAHMDISVENILLANRLHAAPEDFPYTVKLVDYGQSVICQDDAPRMVWAPYGAHFYGKYTCMAPEVLAIEQMAPAAAGQPEGQVLDGHQADWWSLGSILYT